MFYSDHIRGHRPLRAFGNHCDHSATTDWDSATPEIIRQPHCHRPLRAFAGTTATGHWEHSATTATGHWEHSATTATGHWEHSATTATGHWEHSATTATGHWEHSRAPLPPATESIRQPLPPATESIQQRLSPRQTTFSGKLTDSEDRHLGCLNEWTNVTFIYGAAPGPCAGGGMTRVTDLSLTEGLPLCPFTPTKSRSSWAGAENRFAAGLVATFVTCGK